MTESDIEFLGRRAAEELQHAERASDMAAAAIHRRMATLYADRLASISEHSNFDPIVQTKLDS